MTTAIIILFLTMLLNGFFAASEMAIVSSRKARLKQRVDDHDDKGAATALQLLDDSGRFIASVQVGITVLSVFAGAYGGATLAEPLAEKLAPWLHDSAHDIAFTLVITIVTYFSLVIGEIVPKRLGLANAESFACRVARPMQIFATCGAPIVWFLQASSNFIMRLLPFRTTTDNAVTEEEVRTLIAEGTESGIFAEAEKQMLEGVMRLSDRRVRVIMTPRQDVEWLDLDLPLPVLIDNVMASPHSRLLVARGTLDNLAGVLYAKDLLHAYLKGTPPHPETMMREPLIVHETTPVLRLVDLFRSTRQHLAVVVDEHGSIEGIVTTTDILETVTGELPAENDATTAIITRSDGTLLVDAMIPIDELMARLERRDMKEDGDDFDTLAGFMLKILGHIPKTGEKAQWDDYMFEVIDMDGRRIDKILITPPATLAPQTLLAKGEM